MPRIDAVVVKDRRDRRLPARIPVDVGIATSICIGMDRVNHGSPRPAAAHEGQELPRRFEGLSVAIDAFPSPPTRGAPETLDPRVWWPGYFRSSNPPKVQCASKAHEDQSCTNKGLHTKSALLPAGPSAARHLVSPPCDGPAIALGCQAIPMGLDNLQLDGLTTRIISPLIRTRGPGTTCAAGARATAGVVPGSGSASGGDGGVSCGVRTRGGGHDGSPMSWAGRAA
jgi:hypothetical protein